MGGEAGLEKAKDIQDKDQANGENSDKIRQKKQETEGQTRCNAVRSVIRSHLALLWV